ncbi:TNF receptor-associated factor 2-like isoform X1 [Heterodontus francisci]|uniref:TNF receptor-associated factor 2-like isoform X1 n=1 Tax=Heterodontus francisci TaxID=7792 RepID=UPI00355C0633
MTAGKSSLSVLPKPTRSQFALTVFPAVRPAAAADLCLFISFIHWHCPPVREMVARVSGIVPIDLCSSTGLLCSSCGFLLIQPKQTKCGHRYCTACLDCLFLTSDEADCCICQERFHCSEVYADRAAENDAFTTVVECPERKAGCDWKGSLRSYLNSHHAQCDVQVESCVNAPFGCSAIGPRKKMRGHEAEECDWRMQHCPNCDTPCPHILMKGHISMCSQCKDDCSLCGKKGLSKEELNKHCDVDLGDCPRVKVACPFERAGCQEKPERGALSEHLREAQQPHMMQLLSLILSLQSKMSNTADINTSFKQLVMDKILALTGLLSQSVRPEAGSEASRAGMASGSEDPSISMLAKKIESLEKVLCVLNRELDKYESTIELLQQKCLQNEQVIQDLQRKGKAKEGKNYLFGPSPPMNCNGVIVWKIENFSSHLLAARSEQRTSFYSSPFSTDPFGYKLCCRIYPYGDGNGKGTHISLFLAIMKSEYDDVLLWPFKQRVTFVLLDQVNQNHIKESFFPDVLSASFQKPKTHMNVASGCPRFVRQDLLLNPPNPYLRNDAIFLKVVVDTSGL